HRHLWPAGHGRPPTRHHHPYAGGGLTARRNSRGWTGSGSAVFLSLGTCAVPKPRRWASRQPRPAPEGKPSWTPIPLALAFTLRALSGGPERISVLNRQFAGL